MLRIIEAQTSQENIDRGIAAAQTFFDNNLIIAPIVFKEVQRQAEGKGHNKGLVALWHQADNIARKAALGEVQIDPEAETVPKLVWISN